MKRAWNLTRQETHYRHHVFSAGLRAAGFDVQQGPPTNPAPGDVVLSWNRYGSNHDVCTRVERAGGIALIAENGYIGPGGVSPHHQKDRQTYALSRSYHNDSTVIPEGGQERWDALGIDLKPWRTDGKHILVCPNRPFGTPGRIMQMDWPQDVCRRLRAVTKREVRLRAHPGNNAPQKPLADDLDGAWAVVIWSSSAGVHALVNGIPVICEGPYWIAKEATGIDVGTIETPVMPERLPALQRLAWAQWSVEEIASGKPFHHLLPGRQ